MSDKSHVGTGFEQCPVCLTHHSESLLLDKRLEDSLPNEPVCLGHSLCPEHQQGVDDGFVFLIGCDPEKSNIKKSSDGGESIGELGDEVRTGLLMGIKRESLQHVVNRPINPNAIFMFCADEFIYAIQSMA